MRPDGTDLPPPRELEVLIMRQHGRIARLLRELRALLAEGRPMTEVLIVVRALADRFEEHFRTEEQLMRERSYPKRAEHEAEHGHFTAELARILQECERRKSARTEEPPLTIHALERWFHEHEASTDRDLLAFLAPDAG